MAGVQPISVLAKNTSITPVDFAGRVNEYSAPLYFRMDADPGLERLQYKFPFDIPFNVSTYLEGRVYARSVRANTGTGTDPGGDFGYWDVVAYAYLKKDANGVITRAVKYDVVDHFPGSGTVDINVGTDARADGSFCYDIWLTPDEYDETKFFADLRVVEIHDAPTVFRGV